MFTSRPHAGSQGPAGRKRARSAKARSPSLVGSGFVHPTLANRSPPVEDKVVGSRNRARRPAELGGPVEPGRALPQTHEVFGDRGRPGLTMVPRRARWKASEDLEDKSTGLPPYRGPAPHPVNQVERRIRRCSTASHQWASDEVMDGRTGTSWAPPVPPPAPVDAPRIAAASSSRSPTATTNL